MDPNASLAGLRADLVAARAAANGESNDVEIIAWQEVGDSVEALDEWLSRGGFLPNDWQRQQPTDEHIYEKCRDCHLFVEPNEAYRPDLPSIAEFVHLSRGNEADDVLDESHDATPSGMKANLATWQVFGPVAMRERFVTPARFC